MTFQEQMQQAVGQIQRLILAHLESAAKECPECRVFGVKLEPTGNGVNVQIVASETPFRSRIPGAMHWLERP